eukprot:CAMPEP_0167745412 /NCGR_PEP_ID=MMETSP0110_2-20121227/3137_1 /TAXON_ID=629695 /ORGANISM="Gymnochlora sp., Strain CCMP2014" /LENGTH=483 /DNA_ID=CAMNT_0007630051 /DNA_START=264 /DNA_END=1715 /DNA_ORIENTATION=-
MDGEPPPKNRSSSQGKPVEEDINKSEDSSTLETIDTKKNGEYPNPNTEESTSLMTADNAIRDNQVLALNGIVIESIIKLKGAYLGGCFAFELTDRNAKNLLLHINFRPDKNEVVGNYFSRGSWGTEHYLTELPLNIGEKFELEIRFKPPVKGEENVHWGTECKLNGNHILPQLKVRIPSLVKQARINEECVKGGVQNRYEQLIAYNVLNDKFRPEEISTIFDEAVTPKEPGSNFEMLIGILSGPKNREERGGQRMAWMNSEHCKSGRFLVRFFVGRTGVEMIDKEVDEEASKTGDIVILEDLEEDYYKIAHKTKAMVHLAVEIGAKFLFKTDDDSYIDVQLASEVIEGKGKDSVIGTITYNSAPNRAGKWAMPKDEYPNSRYPPFPHGPGYIVGRGILEYVDKKLKDGTLKPLRLEDVSMGIWIDDAKKNGVSVTYVNQRNGRGKVDIGGCATGNLVSHYIEPQAMVCMWEKQKRGIENICCT